MSVIQIRGLGPSLAGLSNPSVALGQTFPGPSSALEQQYMTLRDKCIEQYGPDFCNAVLPRQMIYAITRRGEKALGVYTLPWWVWMLLGLLVGRLVRF